MQFPDCVERIIIFQFHTFSLYIPNFTLQVLGVSISGCDQKIYTGLMVAYLEKLSNLRRQNNLNLLHWSEKYKLWNLQVGTPGHFLFLFRIE